MPLKGTILNNSQTLSTRKLHSKSHYSSFASFLFLIANSNPFYFLARSCELFAWGGKCHSPTQIVLKQAGYRPVGIHGGMKWCCMPGLRKHSCLIWEERMDAGIHEDDSAWSQKGWSSSRHTACLLRFALSLLHPRTFNGSSLRPSDLGWNLHVW